MRLHLLELGDQPWLPRSLRLGVVETLQQLTDVFDPYGASLERFADLLAAGRPEVVVDLCAGAGGPWRRLGRLLAARGCRPRLVLTDAVPDPSGAVAGGGGPLEVRMHEAPVDPRRVPADLGGARTMFNALHHFRPAEIREIVGDAAAAGEVLACLEITEKRPAAFLGIFLVPVGALLVAPWRRPIRLRRIFWTFFLGAIPLVTLLDGLVSCLRSYAPDELLALAREAAPHYVWEAGRERGSSWLPFRGTWLVGRPATAEA
jgi:hypothetical protein